MDPTPINTETFRREEMTLFLKLPKVLEIKTVPIFLNMNLEFKFEISHRQGRSYKLTIIDNQFILIIVLKRPIKRIRFHGKGCEGRKIEIHKKISLDMEFQKTVIKHPGSKIVE